MMETKTHWKKIQNNDYIGSYAINPGEELNVTITEVSRKIVKGPGGKQEECTVAELKNQKPMILNKVNQKVITKVLGSPYIEDWIGKTITLYVAMVDAFGERVEALRIRETKPVIKLPELTPSHPKWEGAKKAIADGATSIAIIKGIFTLTAENETLLTAQIAPNEAN